jgi:hypothetical protein
MPAREAQSFKTNVLQSTSAIRKFHQALKDIAVQKAEATVLADRQNIMRYIKEHLGYSLVNKLVSDALLTWFATASEQKLVDGLTADVRSLVVIVLESCPKSLRAHLGVTLLAGRGFEKRWHRWYA